MSDPFRTGDYVPSPVERSPTPNTGESIGPYRLLEQLGHGGMGEVWLAEQSEPVRRRVALKLIKAGMDTQQVLARFEAERQALALMDHPNIAKMLDAGRTDAGRPYFVMDLVKGTPVTTFCDREKLSLRERLELFIPVCQAVQHAHQKGIIHRDLKPSNILVGLFDGKPRPKVIDFGVAKAINQKLTERTLYTAVGMMVGTPEYMAPEQAEVNNVDIDTRADVYSLGVVLYELLAGSPPFAAKQLREAAFDEMLRVIREVEPPKPSTKLSSSDELPTIAARRKLEPKRLTKSVQGELDWIVMKCLEKERSRRYETAKALGMEIQRYLSDEPVSAGPPSVAYRVRNFVRRKKSGAIAISLVVLSMLAGTIFGMRSGLGEGHLVEAAVDRPGPLDKAGSNSPQEDTLELQRSAERRKLEAILRAPVEMDRGFDGVPLKDVLEFLSNRCEVTFIVDTVAIREDLGVADPENLLVRVPKMSGVSLNTILLFMLAQVGPASFVITESGDYIEMSTILNKLVAIDKYTRDAPLWDVLEMIHTRSGIVVRLDLGEFRKKQRHETIKTTPVSLAPYKGSLRELIISIVNQIDCEYYFDRDVVIVPKGTLPNPSLPKTGQNRPKLDEKSIDK